MKLFAIVALSMFLLAVSINAENNATSANVKSDYEPKASEMSKKIVNDSSKSIVKGIKEIQSLKKNTFESTDEFAQRRNKKISELNNRVTISAKKGSDDYSAGTMSMKSYDADKERIALALSWNKDLAVLMPEVTKLKTVSIQIPREEAKKLFSENSTHFFHIKIFYSNSKLALSEITFYNKYQLYGNTESKKLTSQSETKIDDDKSWSFWVWVVSILSIVILLYYFGTWLKKKISSVTVIDDKKMSSLIIDGKMWQDGPCTIMNWNEAKKYCLDLELYGYSNWRLPTTKELEELYKKRSKLYNRTSGNYWSASAKGGDAWNINFDNGKTYNHGKSNLYFVRCVRHSL